MCASLGERLLHAAYASVGVERFQDAFIDDDHGAINDCLDVLAEVWRTDDFPLTGEPPFFADARPTFEATFMLVADSLDGPWPGVRDPMYQRGVLAAIAAGNAYNEVAKYDTPPELAAHGALVVLRENIDCS